MINNNGTDIVIGPLSSSSPGDAPPGAILVVTGKSNTSISVRVENLQYGASSYDDFVFYLNGAWRGQTGRGGITYTYTGLSANTTYTLSAEAYYNGAWYPAGPTSATTTGGTQPTVVLVVTSITNTSISVRIDNLEHSPSSYGDFAFYLDGSLKAQTGSGNNSYTYTGLSPGTLYSMSAKAYFNNTWYNAGATSASTTGAQPGKLSPPFLESSSSTNNTITVKCSLVPNAYQYYFECQLQGSTQKASRTHTFTGLSTNTTYRVRFRAIGSGSYTSSDYSQWYSVSTLGTPLIDPYYPPYYPVCTEQYGWDAGSYVLFGSCAVNAPVTMIEIFERKQIPNEIIAYSDGNSFEFISAMSVQFVWGNTPGSDTHTYCDPVYESLVSDGVPLAKYMIGLTTRSRARVHVNRQKSFLAPESRRHRLDYYGEVGPSAAGVIRNEIISYGCVTGIIDSGVIDAGHPGGVCDPPYTYRGNHMVTLIGWKYINNRLYWICHNSWGDWYGDNGIVYVPVESNLFSYVYRARDLLTPSIPKVAPVVPPNTGVLLDLDRSKTGRGNSSNLYCTWDAALYTDYYRLYWKKIPGGVEQGPVTVEVPVYNLYSRNGLEPGTTYELRLVAVNSYGSTQYTAKNTATTLPGVSRVYLFNVTRTSITVSVSPPTVGGWDSIKVIGYNDDTPVLLPDRTLTKAQYNSGTETVTWTGLQPGVRYGITCSAQLTVNGVLLVRESNVTVYSRLPTTEIYTPAPPTVSSRGEGSLTVTWSAVPSATGYNLRYRKSSTWGYTTVTVTSTSKTITGLEYGTTYELSVRAYNSIDTSEYSVANPCTTLAKSPGTITCPAVGHYEIDVKVANGIVGNFDYIRIYAYNSGISPSYKDITRAQYNAGNRIVTWQNLSSGTTYRFNARTIFIYNGADLSSLHWSNDLNVATLGPPSKPASAPTVSSRGEGSLNVKWPSSTGATSYTLRYKHYSGSYSTKNVTGTSTTLSGLEYGVTYYLSVRANNSSGSSSYTSENPCTTLAKSPGTITCPAVGPYEIDVKLSNGIVGNFDRVRIYAYNSNISPTYKDITQAQYNAGNRIVTWQNLSRGTTYRFNARTLYTYNGADLSSLHWSNDLNITTLSKPGSFTWPSTNVQKGAPFSMPASDWNAFTTRINAFRKYKGLSDYSFTTAHTGNKFWAYIFNEARTAISAMASVSSVPVAKPYMPIRASHLNGLVNVLNSIN